MQYNTVLSEEYMMKVGLKILSAIVLLLLGFIAVESTCAGTHTELPDITSGNTSNESVRLVLFGFATGISALLLYVVVFKPAARAYVAKRFNKIFRKSTPRDSDSLSFLHDTTRGMNYTEASSAQRFAHPLKKTDELTGMEKKTHLDDHKK